jgi:DNA polymerase I-like protein with 3'-5' exonuclease and polymerase domains
VNGTVTGRPTHVSPNISQVPKVGKPFGQQCRALFGPSKGRVQVGADLAGIELRCLGHYMFPFDNGDYGRAVIEGTQEAGTDAHTRNCVAMGFEAKKLYTLSGKTSKGRDHGKTIMYALLYGAGDPHLGKLAGGKRSKGVEIRERLFAGIPALGRLIEKVKRLAKKQGYLPGLDDRKLFVRSDHSALNTLLQAAGAVIAMLWLVLVDDEIERRGWRDRCQLLGWLHDELQYEADPEIADELGRTVVAMAGAAGEAFGFRLPVDAEYKVGANWAECH